MNKGKIFSVILAFMLGTILGIAGINVSQVKAAETWRSSLYPENWTPGYTNNSGQFLQDFSYAGYERGEKEVPTKMDGLYANVLNYGADNTGAKDSTTAIQNAINAVEAAGGGTVYLPAGTYKVKPSSSSNASALRIKGSNILFKGDGVGKTFIRCYAESMRYSQVINVSPQGGTWDSADDGKYSYLTQDIPKTPTTTIYLNDVSNFKAGDWVIIRSDRTSAWINEHNMSGFWSANVNPTTMGTTFYRQITSVNSSNKTIEIDIPTKYYMKTRDNARVYKVAPKQTNVGLSDFSIGNKANSKTSGWGEEDYNKSGTGAYDANNAFLIKFSLNVNCFARNISTYQAGNSSQIHMTSNGLDLNKSRSITIDNCDFSYPQYEGGGGNGYGMNICAQECLIKNCSSTSARHSFSFKYSYANGNVIYHYTSTDPKYGSDFHMYLSMSNLIDNEELNGDFVESVIRPYGATAGNRHGYTSTETVFWNTKGNYYKSGSSYIIDSRQFGNGYIIGTQGAASAVKTTPLTMSSTYGTVNTNPEDYKEGVGKGTTLYPQSLYYDQLEKRLSNNYGNKEEAKDIPGTFNATEYSSATSGITKNTGTTNYVGNLVSGSTLEYQVNAKETGTYTIDMGLAAGDAKYNADNIIIKLDGKTVSTIPLTGSSDWTTFIEHTAQIDIAEKGNHTIAIVSDGGAVNIGNIKFTKKAVETVSGTAFSQYDFLKCNGTSIRNNYGKGNNVYLRGTNAGGWLVQESWMNATNMRDQKTLMSNLESRFGTDKMYELLDVYESNYWTTSDFDNCKNMGMSVIRVPFTYMNLYRYDTSKKDWVLRDDAFEKLDWFVSECSSRGIYVILDLHGAFGSQNGQDHSGEVIDNVSDVTFFSNDYNKNKTLELWKTVASHFAGNPAVAGYDTLNEPGEKAGTTNSKHWAFYNQMYQTIRAVDPDHIIIMESCWGTGNLPNPKTYGWENVMYEYHHYTWDYISDVNGQKNSCDNLIKSVNNANYGVPTYIGEFTCFGLEEAWNYVMEQFNDAGWHYTSWSYKTTNSGSWGIYNEKSTEKVNLASDSESSIRSKWGANSIGTGSQSTSGMVYKAMKAQLPGTVVFADKALTDNDYFTIKAGINNKYVCADDNGEASLVANRASGGDWEQFRVIYNADGTISFQSRANNKYLCAVFDDTDKENPIVARSNQISTWEKFYLEKQSNGTYALRTYVNNYYVQADINDSNSGILHAIGASVGTWEVFTFEAVSDSSALPGNKTEQETTPKPTEPETTQKPTEPETTQPVVSTAEPIEVFGLVVNNKGENTISVTWGQNQSQIALNQKYNVYVDGVKKLSNVQCGEYLISDIASGSRTIKVTATLGGKETNGVQAVVSVQGSETTAQPEVTVYPAEPGVNMAEKASVSASGYENEAFAPEKAVDGDNGTRWSSDFADNAWITVDLGKVYSINKVVLNWEGAYGKAYKIETSIDGKIWTTVKDVTDGQGGEETVTFTSVGAKYVRMQGVTRALPYGYSLWEMEVYGDGSSDDNQGSQESGINVAKNGIASASGAEAAGTEAKYAVDGDEGTRWSSNFADDAWISVDLGKSYTINKVVLNWEGAYGKAYKIQTSTDGKTWTTVKDVTDGKGGIEAITFNATSARYVRMQGVTRALPYGYSLWEMEVYTK